MAVSEGVSFLNELTVVRNPLSAAYKVITPYSM